MQIRILTFNTWGLKFVSKNRELRLQQIAHRLLSTSQNYDIIALQEVWVDSDWEYLSSLLSHIFPFQRRYSSGIITGPGLAVLSRFKIESCFLYRFPLNGRPSAPYRGDWYVGKSVSISIIRVSPGNTIALMNAHMHAPYGKGDANYLCHRTCQAWDFANLAKLLTSAGHVVIIVGDLNSEPGSLSHTLLTKYIDLHDAWVDRHGEFNGDIGSLSPLQQIELVGTTCDHTLNTYREKCSHININSAIRLDYILYDYKKVHVVDCKVSFWEKMDTNNESYSDHFAVEAVLQLRNVNNTNLINNTNDDLLSDSISPNDVTLPLSFNDSILSHQQQHNEEDDEEINRSSSVSLKHNTSDATLIGNDIFAKTDESKLLSDILSLILEYKKTSIWQRKIRLLHFSLSVIFLVGLSISSFWIRGNINGGKSWTGFVTTFLGIVVGITGFADFLMGWVFGWSEWRALQEYEEQIKLAANF